MKQQIKITKAKNGIKSHKKEIKKLEDKIKILRESMKYKIVNYGAKEKGTLGTVTFCPEPNNPRMLNVKLDENYNSLYGTTIRYQSVKKLRNYLNDFLKTRQKIVK